MRDGQFRLEIPFFEGSLDPTKWSMDHGEVLRQYTHTGTTYSVRFGPFPFVVDEQKNARYKGGFKIYGAVTLYIFYANRSIIVGFALDGGQGTPPTHTSHE
jgi:hypothetical protein